MESITKLQHSRTRSLSRERHNSRDEVLSELIDDEDLGPLDLSLKTSVMPQKIYEMQEEIGRLEVTYGLVKQSVFGLIG